jgi:hypothetical protein
MLLNASSVCSLQGHALCFIFVIGVTFVTSGLVGQHQQVALVSKSRLMLPAQQITVVTNGVGGEVAREGENNFWL